MRFVRVEIGSTSGYGVLDEGGESVRLLEGTPFDSGDHTAGGPSVELSRCRVLPPVQPTKILAIGSNYAAHAHEMGARPGAVPSVFMKPLQTLTSHGAAVVLPPKGISSEIEHEAELAVVIGREARHVARADAAAYVCGFTCANDVSARDLQRSDPQITRSKGFDTFCPLGPYVETDVKLTEPLDVTCRVNGELRQAGSTSELLFDIPALVEFLSAWTTLMPGDVILTGSPAGSGPLCPGDEVEISVGQIGVLRHAVVASPLDGR